MNPHEWRDAVQRLRRLLEPNCHSMGNVSRTNRDLDIYRECPRYTAPESRRGDVGWKELSPSSHYAYSKVPEMEDPDGEPLQECDDAELARKKKQLREIEERIMHKKASIAMKGVCVESSTPPGVSDKGQPATCEGETLRDRVKDILRQQQHLSCPSKVQSTRERKNSSSLIKDGVLQEQHPLKLRVQVLMKRRHSVLPSISSQIPDVPDVPDVPRSPPGRSVTSPAKREDIVNKGFECFLGVLNKGMDISLLTPEDDCREVPDVSPPPPGRSISSPAKEEDIINKGFERFLKILNKGVDIEKLSRIMRQNGEDLPLGEEPLSIQLPDVESKSDPSFRSEGQRANSEVSLLGLSQAGDEQHLNRGTLLEGLSHTNNSLLSMASDCELGANQTKESQRLKTSLPSPPSENQYSSRVKESKQLKSGALLPDLGQSSKTQQSNSGSFLKGLSKSQRLKSGTFIPGLGETSDSESESNDGSPLGGLTQAKQTEDPPRRPDRDLKSGASLAGGSRTNITETKINSPSRERPHCERLSLPAAEEKNNDRGDHSVGPSSQSKSPMAVKKKKKEEEREENPTVSEQHEQLQNILKTLGWNLDLEELSKLANRTLERLYGKKTEGAHSREEHESRPTRSHDRDRRKSSSSRSPLRSSKANRSQERMCGRRRTEGRGEEETQQRCSLRNRRRSPSTSSSTPSSNSASSPRASRQRRSRSRDFRRKVERSRSGESSRDRRSSREAQTDQKDLNHFPPYPYPQTQMCPPPPPASTFPDYILSQYSHFAPSHSGHYGGAMSPYWTYNQYNIPPPLSASSHPYPCFSGSVVAPNTAYADPRLPMGSASFPNPDLSVSEGQVGSSSGPRCLTVINTEQASSQGLTGGCNWNLGYKKILGDFQNPKTVLETNNNTPKSPVAPQESKVCTKTADDNPPAEQLEEEKPQPTEQEIKANLRKKLKAFNQKAKNTSQLPHSIVMQPANSLISEME